MADETRLIAPEVEQAVLGAFIADPALAPRVLEVPEGLFATPRHRLILGAIRALHGRGFAADAVTIMGELRTGGAFDRAGGSEYLGALVNSVVGSSRFDEYLRILRDKATLRATVAHLRSVIDSAQNGGGSDPRELIDRGVAGLLDISRDSDRGDYVRASDLVMPAFDEIEAARTRGSAVTGIATGIARLDEMTAGIQPGEMHVYGGAPSVGKSALAHGVIRHATLEEGLGAGLFTLEMPRTDIVKRTLSAEAKIPFPRLRAGRLDDAEYERLGHAAGLVKSMNLVIDDTSDLTTVEMRTRARRMVEREGVSLIVIDYLQLVRVHGIGAGNREQEVAEVSRTCKAIARELDVGVVALSQLSRARMTRSDRRPVLSDLRESGAIEQDADLVLVPYRPQQDPGSKGSDRYPGATEEAELVLRKQRNGPTGVIPALFNGELMTWSERG